MSKYPIEHYKTLLVENPTWLGQQAVYILEHYAALEAKLEAMEQRLVSARQLIEDVGGRDDWEGRAADWLGITAREE